MNWESPTTLTSWSRSLDTSHITTTSYVTASSGNEFANKNLVMQPDCKILTKQFIGMKERYGSVDTVSC